MRYFFDFEFMEDGRVIEPLSIGIVSQDAREYYAEFSHNPDHANDWVREHVLPKLWGGQYLKPRDAIRQEILAFIGPEKPEWWGYYVAYDQVAFCQLFGRMVDLPKGWPMYARDVKQWADALGNPRLPPEGKDEHHSLADARWIRDAWLFLAEEELRRVGAGVRRELALAALVKEALDLPYFASREEWDRCCEGYRARALAALEEGD